MQAPRFKTLNHYKINLVNIPSHALQSEGSSKIVKTLKEYSLDGVVVFPAFYTEVNDNGRWRLPPLLNSFERTVFNKKRCRIERRSPFPHDEKYYQNTSVTPVQYKGHQDIWTPFIKSCKSEGLKVFLAMVPLVSFDDVENFVPRYYDDSPFEEYLGFLCPNHPDVMSYALDSVNELIERFAEDCDGLLFDHVEYPAYSLKECFTCFCKYCREKAEKNGINVDKAIQQADELIKKLNHIIATTSESDWEKSYGMVDGVNIALSCADLVDYMHFKIETITQVQQQISAIITRQQTEKPLGNGAFAPTYSKLTGVDYNRLDNYFDFFSPKFYSQHWTRMLTNTLNELNATNSNRFVQQKVIDLFTCFTGTKVQNLTADSYQVCSESIEQEIIKMKMLSSKPFIPWVNCEGSAKDLEIKLELLNKHNIKNTFFQEYMFLNSEKLNLIKNYINK